MHLQLPQFPQWIDVELYTDVNNSKELREKLLKGQLQCSLIDATCVSCKQHLMAAIYRALLDTNDGHRRTKNVHSETVFCMSPNNNIMDALTRFGLKEDSKAVYVVRIRDTDEFAENEILVDGNKATTITDEIMAELCDKDRLKKIYKSQDPVQIVGSIALRGH